MRARDLPRLVVMAKAPRPGMVKTRLCPPCSPGQAARLAEAALVETLGSAVRARGAIPTLVLEGPRGPWLPPGVEVVPQRGRGLDERLAHAIEEAGGPVLLIGMDTPQVTPPVLEAALERLASSETDAVLGRAVDGGWWALGLRGPDPRAVLGVPMSTPHTGAHQLSRLRELELRCTELPVLRDVDRFEDALEVAEEIPESGFAAAVAEVRRELGVDTLSALSTRPRVGAT